MGPAPHVAHATIARRIPDQRAMGMLTFEGLSEHINCKSSVERAINRFDSGSKMRASEHMLATRAFTNRRSGKAVNETDHRKLALKTNVSMP
jgi:hypothetical protein